MNEHDSERVAGLLEARGLSATDDVAEADIVLFNTCCVREHADRRLYGQLGSLLPEKSRRPDMKVIVGGCLAQKDGAELAERAPHVDVVFGTHNLARLPDLLDAATHSSCPIVEIWEEGDTLPSMLPAKREVPYAAWVTVSIGCNNSCTFCIVPTVRGPEVSRPPADIAGECRSLVADGVVEITLLGQNVNSYGRDIDGRHPRFADLLRTIDGIDGLKRIRFTSPHPKDLRAETIAAIAQSPTVCEQLHLPVQAGSDRILAAMHRGYTAERYLAKLAAAREAVRDLTVSTDIIVGFPGETEADFQATLDLVEAAQFDSAFTFIYSPRPGTPAVSMDDPVGREEKQERYERLAACQNAISWSRNVRMVGGRYELLIEGPSKKDQTRISGRTRGGKLVHVADDGRCVPGTFRTAEITSAASHYLAGTLVD